MLKLARWIIYMLDKKIVATDNAPKAIGPYSQGVKVGDFLFISGQIPLDAKTGRIIGTTISEQTEQVLKNIQGIVSASGATMNDVVKTTVYLKDLNEFAIMNDVYARFFKSDFPARATVEVSALPKSVKIEIDAIVRV